MKWLRLALVCLMAGCLGMAADAPDNPRTAAGQASQKVAPAPVPPVMRDTDQDTGDVVVQLPGAAAPKAEALKDEPAAAVTPPEPSKASGIAPAAIAPHPSPKVFYPPAFEQNSAVFCQKMIGQWTEDDARFLLGQPIRQRPAYGDNQTVNGHIFAFSDPTGRYKELELDFESGTGLLRTVFVYPLNMTWQECRRQWGGEVSATEANKGRKFYSYMDRRLDVLVDPSGKVISLGLY